MEAAVVVVVAGFVVVVVVVVVVTGVVSGTSMTISPSELTLSVPFAFIFGRKSLTASAVTYFPRPFVSTPEAIA